MGHIESDLAPFQFVLLIVNLLFQFPSVPLRASQTKHDHIHDSDISYR
jgi:hypothetical protein